MRKLIFIPAIIVILFKANFIFAAEDIKILVSSPKGITFEFTPQYIDEKDHFKNDRSEILPLFRKASDVDLRNTGSPDYRYRSSNLGLQNLFGNTIAVVSTEYIDLHGVQLKAIPHLKYENGFLTESERFQTPSEYNSIDPPALVELAEIGFVRNQIIGTVKISPYQQISNQNLVRLYKKIVVQVTYGVLSSDLIFTGKQGLIVEDLLNSNIAANWTFEKQIPTLKKITSSVFNTGSWYRIKITEEGIYKLDNTFLKAKGIELSGVDPRTIKIYNNGGRMLDERPEQPRTTDLIENAIQVIGEEDGKFDISDAIVFYGRGTKSWEYNTSSKSFSHYFHSYSDNNYYWLTWGGAIGKRITAKSSSLDAATDVVTSTTGFVLNHEFKKKVSKTGREWFGDEFNDRTRYRIYNNKLPGLIPEQTITYKFNVISRSPVLVTFSVEENSSLLGSIPVNPISTDDGIGYYAHKASRTFTRNSTLPDSRSILRLTYNVTDPIANGYLDYFEIFYPRSLSAETDKIMFFSPTKTAVNEYRIGNFSSSEIVVYDVSNFSDVKNIGGGSISGMQINFKANEVESNPSRYYAIGKNGYSTPVEVIKIANQNLHGITSGAEFIIITPKEFKSQADRLKSFKESRKRHPIKTIVINLDEIYNEFSAGILDVTAIRDFVRHAYQNWTTKPTYVLLFGDGDYDYRNIEAYGKNFIPPYETEESLYLIYSYPTDDYYARIIGNDLYVDIVMGRITCRSADEAKVAVDKIISYETSQDFGQWRNLVTFVADDGKTTKGDDGDLHTAQTESLSRGVQTVPKSFDQKKIYLIQYPTVETASGRRKPDVNKAIASAVNEGTLVLNFIGHGNPEVWTHEFVFEKAVSIPQFKNKNRLFFLSAATCDFGDYDNPSSQSSAELLLAKEDGGAISVFTAARAVWSHLNYEINEALFTKMFSWRNTNSSQPTIGMAYFLTKINRIDPNDQKYHLFGDPTIYLNVPMHIAGVDSINGKSSKSVVEIKSLSNTSIAGVVKDSIGNVLSGLSGEALITVYDSKRFQEIPEWPYFNSRYGGIELSGGIIFRGRSMIRNGIFKSDFVVPKDVSYENNQGKVTVYFNSTKEDGFGMTENIRVTAADTINITDKIGPQIDIFFDNDASAGAYLVGTSPLLIVKLEDETGINTTGTGIGHKMEAVLDDDISNPIDLTNYFQGALDQGNRKGEVKYQMSQLDQGPHKLKITAWDVFNNPSSSSTNFEVVGDNIVAVRDVFNYPNPTTGNTTFTFQHNFDKPVNFKIKIYTVAGRLIQTIERNNVIEKFVKVPWDGRDAEGDQIGNGVYLYKIIVNSLDNSYKNEAIGKLAIVR
ncbi:MAG: type IX secretion system sortase PorU [Bacteroidetes bacterium]|nr:type IX secretion system sortase PorU [Bacteroidota bacterium]MBU2583835.1 type IX secretion system sortase PorU [Bacteroidota bacterium]